MTFSCKQIDILQSSKACPVIGVYEDGELTASAKKLDKALAGKIQQVHENKIFTAKLGQTFLLVQEKSAAQPYVLLVGCGKKATLTPLAYKKIIAAATSALKAAAIRAVSCFLTEIRVASQPLTWHIKLIAETAQETLYQFDVFKSERLTPFSFSQFILALSSKDDPKRAQKALQQGLAIANGVTLTKNLANTPSNICTPTFLADQAKELKKTFKSLKLTVLDEKAMHKLGMGALLGVSQGSAEEAKLICLEYQGGKKNQAPIVLVGKGVTFDTGGNSLKPADAMVGMKYDMCGAATVLGTLRAAAELKLPLNVIGVIPAVENMPGGTAYKPEDILTSMSGQTIEVISTDAEGRLALCDALTYCERFKPDTVIDIATLTGAVVIALGSQATGLLSNHDPLAKQLLQASEESLDRAWQLPLWEEYQEQIKSPFADMANVGGRSAGTITAGCFLARFAKKFKWAHLDVAGTAAVMAGTSERKATGRPVPMLVQYLLNRC